MGSDEKRLVKLIDLDPEEVGERLREAAASGNSFERFADECGEPTWINAANVLWLEPTADEPSITAL